MVPSKCTVQTLQPVLTLATTENQKRTLATHSMVTSIDDPSTRRVDVGRNASSRSWKSRTQKRASTLQRSKARLTWERKLADKRSRQEALALQQELSEEKRQAILQKKERRLENEKRRAENELKVVERSAQTLNHSKVGRTLKAMSKKQLRMIKKSRMNPKTGVVEYVSAYAK